MATNCFKLVVDTLNSLVSLKDEHAVKRRSLLLVTHLNFAICYINLERYTEAITSCEEALQLEVKNEVALLRRGMVNEFTV